MGRYRAVDLVRWPNSQTVESIFHDLSNSNAIKTPRTFKWRIYCPTCNTSCIGTRNTEHRCNPNNNEFVRREALNTIRLFYSHDLAWYGFLELDNNYNEKYPKLK